MQLIQFRPEGLYCEAGDFFIDPWRPVHRAVITHAHSDHARWGMKHYLAHRLSIPVMQLRLGADISVQSVEYGEVLTLGGVRISFHPAGHLPGSAQIRVEYNSEVWVVSGDYKTENDGLSDAFEPVRCHTFITESTFGLPVFRWKPQQMVFDGMNAWWSKNKSEGKTTVIYCYSLGKAQRLMHGLNPELGTIWTHGAVENTNQVLRVAGVKLPHTRLITADTSREAIRGGVVLAPPSVDGSPWMKKLGPVSTAMASGWMAVRGIRRRRNTDTGIVLSDHADWPGLIEAVKGTGAQRVFVTHGYAATFAAYLRECGYDAAEVKTEFAGDHAGEEAE
jgi:putative mRNA 3-end processing factor